MDLICTVSFNAFDLSTRYEYPFQDGSRMVKTKAELILGYSILGRTATIECEAAETAWSLSMELEKWDDDCMLPPDLHARTRLIVAIRPSNLGL